MTNEQNEQFEQNANKYLDFGKVAPTPEKSESDAPGEKENAAEEEQPQEEAEQSDEDQPTAEEQQEAEEIEAQMKAQYDEVLASQKKYKVELPEGVEDLVKQREAFFQSNDMDALVKKMQACVNPESDKLFITWIITRFPALFERLTKEEQLALIRHYNLSV